MSMHTYDLLSRYVSKKVTTSYSTSFSLGISLLHRSIRQDVYAIYAFVRLADEIVDTFHEFDKKALLDDFTRQTYNAIDQKISLNPVLHQLQYTVNHYHIDRSLIDTFLESMRMDLDQKEYNKQSYEKYILGSAEVVGLMCLQIFVNGDVSKYQSLTPYAKRLGAAFQKINFLRDLKADSQGLGRRYFPQWQHHQRLSEQIKTEILQEIKEDFKIAREGICKLPGCCKFGVYTAYVYYKALMHKITRTPCDRLLNTRIRINNGLKLLLLFYAGIRIKLRLVN